MNGANNHSQMNQKMEDDTGCFRPAVHILFILNIIIWLGSCALLGLGIFGLVDSPFTRSVTDGNLMMVGAVVLILVGGIGFAISFIGCCGAINKNKCLIMTYVIVVSILLAALLIGGILGFLFTNRLRDAAVETMRNTLQQYNIRNQDSPTVKGWDTMQRSLKCCGVISYRDWETFNTNFRGNQKIPESCCIIESSTGRIRSGCTSASNSNDFFSKSTDGCHNKLIQLFDQHTPIVAIVTAIVALFMIVGVILGIIVFTRI